jgi:anaerobic selenocysteine-containing dehydrogenase
VVSWRGPPIDPPVARARRSHARADPRAHSRDARPAGIRDGDFAEVTSRRGKAVAQCRVSETIREGTCANNLTSSAGDPLSKQPELKECAERLRRLSELSDDR